MESPADQLYDQVIHCPDTGKYKEQYDKSDNAKNNIGKVHISGICNFLSNLDCKCDHDDQCKYIDPCDHHDMIMFC